MGDHADEKNRLWVLEKKLASSEIKLLKTVIKIIYLFKISLSNAAYPEALVNNWLLHWKDSHISITADSDQVIIINLLVSQNTCKLKHVLICLNWKVPIAWKLLG